MCQEFLDQSCEFLLFHCSGRKPKTILRDIQVDIDEFDQDPNTNIFCALSSMQSTIEPQKLPLSANFVPDTNSNIHPSHNVQVSYAAIGQCYRCDLYLFSYSSYSICSSCSRICCQICSQLTTFSLNATFVCEWCQLQCASQLASL